MTKDEIKVIENFIAKDRHVMEFEEIQAFVKMQYELYRRMMNRTFIINNTIFTGKDGQYNETFCLADCPECGKAATEHKGGETK